MAKFMKISALVFTLLFLCTLTWLLLMPNSVILSIVITFGVFSYHLVVRLCVGTIINGIFHNKFNYNLFWFKEKRFEHKLYKFLNVKKWTKNVPTYSADTFSPKKHSWHEIAMATCQAELVHEIIIILSFLPLLLIIYFSSAAVFILTSVFSALVDMFFVIIQRYNRPKLIKHIERCEQRKTNGKQ